MRQHLGNEPTIDNLRPISTRNYILVTLQQVVRLFVAQWVGKKAKKEKLKELKVNLYFFKPGELSETQFISFFW